MLASSLTTELHLQTHWDVLTEMSRKQLTGTKLRPGEMSVSYLTHRICSLVLPPDPLPFPWVLQEVELRLLGEAACQCLYSRPGPFNLTFQLLPGMLCAGYPEGRKDTCQVRRGLLTYRKQLRNRQMLEPHLQWNLVWGVRLMGTVCA